MSRTQYSFKITGDVNAVNNALQNFLNANKFIIEEKNGEKYYKSGDAFVGYKYFNYELNGNDLIIYAWLKGLTKEMGIEHDGMMSINAPSLNYKKTLEPLFDQINSINNGIVNNQLVNNNEVNSTYDYKNDILKKQETMCEVGFWLSVVGLIISFFGIIYGAIIYVLCYYFAYQGLSTRKRVKSIITFVLATLSIVVIIVKLIMLNMN